MVPKALPKQQDAAALTINKVAATVGGATCGVIICRASGCSPDCQFEPRKLEFIDCRRQSPQDSPVAWLLPKGLQMEPRQPGHIGCCGEGCQVVIGHVSTSGHRLEKGWPSILLDLSHLPTEFYSGAHFFPKDMAWWGSAMALYWCKGYASRPEVTGASIHAGWSGRP